MIGSCPSRLFKSKRKQDFLQKGSDVLSSMVRIVRVLYILKLTRLAVASLGSSSGCGISFSCWVSKSSGFFEPLPLCNRKFVDVQEAISTGGLSHLTEMNLIWESVASLKGMIRKQMGKVLKFEWNVKIWKIERCKFSAEFKTSDVNTSQRNNQWFCVNLNDQIHRAFFFL